MLFGAGVATIGAGLMYTLSLYSSTGHWTGFQIIAGIGIGSCFQVPIMAGQALAAPEDVSVVTSILLCKLSPHHAPLHITSDPNTK